MQHDLSANAPGFRLRPVEIADAAFMCALRSDPALGRFLNATSPDPKAQENYIRNYFTKPGDYYFIVEGPGGREGMIAIYDVEDGSAEWGRWLIKPGTLAALPSAWMIYGVAFEQLDLNTLYCRTVAANGPVVSFHDNFGVPRRAVLKDYFRQGDFVSDSIEHSLPASDWRALKARHEPMLKRLGARFGAA